MIVGHARQPDAVCERELFRASALEILIATGRRFSRRIAFVQAAFGNRQGELPREIY